MDTRITEYFDERPELVEERIEEARQIIADEIEKNRVKISKQFQHAFDEVYQKAAGMQKAGKKEAIAYVCISILRSSLLTKTYQLRIDLYNSNLYLDRTECANYWDVGFAFQQLDNDIDYFTKCARKKIVRIQQAEILLYMQDYQEHYFDLLEEFCVEHIAGLLELPSWKALKKQAEIKFTYGEYLDKGVILKTDYNQINERTE